MSVVSFVLTNPGTRQAGRNKCQTRPCLSPIPAHLSFASVAGPRAFQRLCVSACLFAKMGPIPQHGHVCVHLPCHPNCWKQTYLIANLGVPSRRISYKNSSPDSKAVNWKKSKLGVWRLILSRYDIVLPIQHINNNIDYSVYKSHIL